RNTARAVSSPVIVACSSSSINREYPTASAARMAARCCRAAVAETVNVAPGLPRFAARLADLEHAELVVHRRLVGDDQVQRRVGTVRDVHVRETRCAEG